MSEWEDKLPPIVKEKLAKIGTFTPEEKEKLKASAQLDSLLSEFYKGSLDSQGLSKRLKIYKDEGKLFLLKEAQIRMLDSVTLESTEAELNKQKTGILAIEALKSRPNTPTLEQNLNSINALQARYKKEMLQQYNYLKSVIEKNPQLRLQQVKQGEATVVMQLTVDEAIKLSPDWKRFLTTHQRRYSQEFAATVEKLKLQVK